MKYDFNLTPYFSSKNLITIRERVESEQSTAMKELQSRLVETKAQSEELIKRLREEHTEV